MFVSVIIPVREASQTLPRCLDALFKTTYHEWECILIDDGASADSLAAAAAYDVQVIRNDRPPGGPAQARNLGAQMAQGKVLFFMDADVMVQPEAVGQVAAIMGADEAVAACFGSYDDSPTELNFLSQYRNLQHHFVHQTSRQDAITFWSGCGAVRRQPFLDLGGFNTCYRRPSIEDIELGYRLRASGYSIRLIKSLQARHMKRWTARQLLRTDIRDRAIPWTQLILKQGRLPNDLNLQFSQRISAGLVLLGLVAALAACFFPWVWLLVGFCISLLLILNRAFYGFLRHQRGIGFVLLSLPWHWLYFVYSSLSFAGGVLWYRLLRFNNPSPGLKPLPPLSHTPRSPNQV
jgi:glycosyltransferase involved in cell wall biosynthesis